MLIPVMAQSPTTALYRWYNSGNGDHFYTTDPTGELAPSSGYVSEGITGYVGTSQMVGTTALYRWYNSGNGDHFYTTDPTGELAPSSGYVSEGITGYLWTSGGNNYQKGALLVGPISLQAARTDPQDILFLEKGRPYIIVGEGTCSLWDNPPEPDGVDSCFVYAKWRIGDTPQIWGQLELIDPSIHLSELIEKNTGKLAEYNPSHIYEAVVIGEGKTLKARVYDGGGYSDNHGELRISVYQAV
ncbi:MAG: hypothetical protein NTY37_10465 [Methanothrix sp.]|nr:hypothetical protein [Methanothrix sp.]